MRLVWPSRDYLASYVAALERGWSPDNIRGAVAAQDELRRIGDDADAFVASLVDREAAGPPITLPDGTTVPRLPGYRRWMWDGEFCGSISFRWQRGTEALPPYCLGHIGYSVVPWKQRHGYATAALRELLEDAKNEALRFVELTTAPDNAASRRVIEANGGILVEEFVTPDALGAQRELRYRIYVQSGPSEIREERPIDVTAIREVNTRAFGDPREARIVDALRSNGAMLLSLVATLHGRVVGHIIYSPASVGDISGAALGPVAVLPEHQRQGTGSRLIQAGNRKLLECGCPFVLVVGHPDYYSRFGFRPGSSCGITCEWDVPDEVFMVAALDSAKMREISGTARYRPEFSSVA